MFDSPRSVFSLNVLPAYRAFFERRREGKWGRKQLLRLGIDAAVALYHLHEHLPTKPTRAALERKCAAFGLVADIANVSKHGTLTRNPSRRISSAGQISEVLAVTEYRDEVGVYRAPQVEVHVKLDDGTTQDLAQLLHEVMTMWCDELRALQIIDMRDNPEAPVLDGHVSRKEAEKRTAGLEITKGEEHRLEMVLRRFNYAINRSEPMDLTGCDVRFVVRKLPESIPIHMELTNGGHTVEFDYEIPLTIKQAERFVTLRTEEQKGRFTQRLLARNRKLSAGLHAAMQQAVAESLAARK